MGAGKDLILVWGKKKDLRYGENPHQKATYFADPESKDPLALHKFEQVQGKELSFNNILDADGAIYALSQLEGERPACVIVKHTNPCGAAYGINEWDAFYRAWYEGDSLAAFGGIIAINRPVDSIADLMIADKFFEVLLVPEIGAKALKVFSGKKDLRILVNPALFDPKPPREYDMKRVRGGMLIQEADTREITEEDLKVVTKIKPSPEQIRDLLFAWKICKATKSNTIVVARDGVLVASGAGQQDRKRCCELCASKMKGKVYKAIRSGDLTAASDAFFPKSDGPNILIRAGVKAIIQPGGSIRDQETVNLCNKKKVAMVFTGIRCFRH